MSRIKETSFNSNASVGNILDRAVGKDLTNPEVVHALPNFKSLRNFIYKSKNPSGKFNLEIDDIPDHLKKDSWIECSFVMILGLMLTIDFFYSFMRMNCFVSQTQKY